MCDFDVNMDDIQSTGDEINESTEILGSSTHTYTNSVFDDEHPLPSYEELRNAGFSEYLAHHISEGDCHSYSDSELYHVLYESENPVTAYNDMMDGKAQAAINKADAIIEDVENSGLLGNTSEGNNVSSEGKYNSTSVQTPPDDNPEPELGLADCWPACKALTGDVSNNAGYGFHA